jgi:hypothetical protein
VDKCGLFVLLNYSLHNLQYISSDLLDSCPSEYKIFLPNNSLRMKEYNQFVDMIVNNRKQITRYTILCIMMLSVMLNIKFMGREVDTDDDDDDLVSNYMNNGGIPTPKAYTRLSSFLDFSWASWGKDTTQFETLLPPSEIDFTIDNRLQWNEPDKCDDILMLMPYLKANNGQGSQLNSYLMASALATFLGKALVIIEPPRSINKYETGSQFGCPVDAFEDDTYTHVKDDFPDGLLRLIKHPNWISHGCAVPTCGGTIGYNKWDALRQTHPHPKIGPMNEIDCVENGRNIKVTPIIGKDLRDFFHHRYKSQMLLRSTPEAKENAYNWAIRLGARHRDATHFSNLTNENQIWDYLTGRVAIIDTFFFMASPK